MRRHQPVPIGVGTVITTVIAVLAGLVVQAPGARAATLPQIGNFGAHPGNIQMHPAVDLGWKRLKDERHGPQT
ncbi:hypothetical protein [Streptosporangium sp. NBC_01469]|uniref:hypothetical protein n=1 Tax=Streptosporangium sp. NBC_01469 TaxID=2903898 RepID=UPI002E29DDAB|nr:hypothetical protein [Streptosporangium sp. NBC_01469]